MFNGPVKDILKVQSLLQRAPKLQSLQGITNNTIQIGEDASKEECSQTNAAQDHDASTSSAQTSSIVSTPTIKIDDTDSSSGEDEEEEGNPRKKARVDGEELLNLMEDKWLQIEKCILTPSDQNLLVQGKRLNDHHINFAQCLL